MMRERYYTSAWEWECCGGPLRVGDAAELEVQYDSDYAESMRSELANELPEPLTGVESHHDDESVVQHGRIVALDAVIADMKWVVTPRDTPTPRLQALGDGSFVSFGNTEPGQAEGESVQGTSRLVPVSVLPDEAAVPEGAGPDLTVFGEQISPELTGYVITIEVFEERQISDYH